MQVKLIHNPDILASLGAVKDGQVLVGFAAETQDILQHAQEKLERKYLDLIVANDVSAPDSGFAVDTNQVTIDPPFRRGGVLASPQQRRGGRTGSATGLPFYWLNGRGEACRSLGRKNYVD